MSETRLVKNVDENRYELDVDGTPIGVIEYHSEGDVVDMTHTEVDPEHGGKGYAALLAAFALEDVRDSGLRVQPTCPYIATYIDRHPEFAVNDARREPATD